MKNESVKRVHFSVNLYVMDKEYIGNLQKRVKDFFREISSLPLQVITQDCCSEISRLVGSWILLEKPTTKVTILKGLDVHQSKGNSHELLSIEYAKKAYLIDPTVWQIFPDSEQILIGAVDPQDVFIFLEKTYGGHWAAAEILDKKSIVEEQKLVATIRETIQSIEAEQF